MHGDSIPERVCIICGTPLAQKKHETLKKFIKRKSCSQQCSAKAGWLHANKIERQQTAKSALRPCETCGRIYKPNNGQQQFCSVSCGSLSSWQRRIEEKDLRSEVSCVQCGTKFITLKSELRIGHGKFCSQDCLSASRRFPERVITCAFCGKIFTYRKLQTRTFCSRTCVRKAELRKSREKHSIFELSVVTGLIELGYTVIPQHRVGRFTVDAFLPTLMIAVECQGDFFHCNPIKYPDGPVNIIQERNIERDIRRKPIIEGLGYRLVHVWESDVDQFGVIGALERVGLRRIST